MAKPFLTVLSFALLYTFAVRGNSWQQGECQINRINAQEPSPDHIRAEGGVTEYWDHKIDDFQCAGVSIFRHRLQSKSLLVPLYYNAPILAYVLKGRGIYGVMISGCPETYESSQQSQQQQGQEGERSQRFGDGHQKIGHYRQGDIIAIPAGAAHWIYNEDDEESVLIVLLDITNNVNQLDQNPRTFFLAGTLPQQQQQGQQGQKQGSQRDKDLPFPTMDVNQLTLTFAKKGLTQDEMIILSGAHTLGQSHCKQFSNRLYNFSATSSIDPSLDPIYAAQLMQQCPRDADQKIAVQMDPLSPTVLDSFGYYNAILANRGLFISDQTLISRPETKAQVVQHAQNQFLWANKFTRAMVKMGHIDVFTGNASEIRSNCRVINN